MILKSKLIGIILLSCLTGLVSAASAIEKNTVAHNTKLQIYFAGIPVGKIKLYYSIKDSAFRLTVFSQTSGVSKLISDAKATIKSEGTNANGKLQVSKYWIDYFEGDDHVTRSVSFSDGNITNIVSKPPIRIYSDSVPVLPKHAINVVDAASSSFMSVPPQQIDNGPAICNRTLRIFDGESRLNLRLQYKGKRRVRARGFKGTAYICSVRYEPIAGQRTGKKQVKYMARNRDIELTMARIGNSSVYGVIQFSVATPVGRITGDAYKFLTELR